jgi:hypothetical protein
MADVVNKAAHQEWRYTEAEFMGKAFGGAGSLSEPLKSDPAMTIGES